MKKQKKAKWKKQSRKQKVELLEGRRFFKISKEDYYSQKKMAERLRKKVQEQLKENKSLLKEAEKITGKKYSSFSSSNSSSSNSSGSG